MKIVFMGTPEFALPSVKALCDVYDVCAVFCQPDKPKGRGMKLSPPPVKEFALTKNIPVYQPSSLKKELDSVLPILEKISPDCIVVAAYGKILPPEIIHLPRFGCINVHGSLLPKFRGAAPIQHTILCGDKEGGITVMKMSEGLDTGDILSMKAVSVNECETSAEYYDRLSVIGSELLMKTLPDWFAGKITPKPQDESKASYAPMLTKDMCPTDFSKSAREVYNHINGLSDKPGASAILDGKRIKIFRAKVTKESGNLGEPGEIIDEKEFTVACKSGSVSLLEIQAEGSKRLNYKDYLRGRPVKPGSKLIPG